MKNKQPKLAPPYAAETRDVRLAGTFEVLVPVPDRNKPQKVPLQFASLNEAEAGCTAPMARKWWRKFLPTPARRSSRPPNIYGRMRKRRSTA